jgi:hypothetical protein
VKVVIASFCCPVAAAKDTPVLADDAGRLFNATRFSQVSEQPGRWKASPGYLKVTLLQALVARVGDSAKATWEKSDEDPKGYDFETVSGRAFWGSAVLTDYAPKDGKPLADPEVAKKAIAAYCDALDAAATAKAYDVGKLKAKYAGKITPGIHHGGAKANDQMFALLDEWWPLGKKLDDLEEIIGHKGEVKDGWVRFTFDTGFAGGASFFAVEDGVIRQVTYMLII